MYIQGGAELTSFRARAGRPVVRVVLSGDGKQGQVSLAFLMSPALTQPAGTSGRQI